LSNDTCDIWH